MKKPILVVEDDIKLLRIVTAYLEAADFKVIAASTAKDALELAAQELPSILLLDLGLPDKSGEELCQEIKEIADIPIIMLTAKSAEEERIAGFALGADDYVVKPASPKELVCRVKAVLKRYEKNSSSKESISFNNGSIILNSASFEVAVKGSSIQFTSTEFRILHTLASTPNRILTREELLSKALGYNFDGYERSIDAHIKNIRHKIEDDIKTPKYIKTVYGAGYQFCGVKDAS